MGSPRFWFEWEKAGGCQDGRPQGAPAQPEPAAQPPKPPQAVCPAGVPPTAAGQSK